MPRSISVSIRNVFTDIILLLKAIISVSYLTTFTNVLRGEETGCASLQTVYQLLGLRQSVLVHFSNWPALTNTPSHYSHHAISYSLSALQLFLQHCHSISFCLDTGMKLLLRTRRTREDTTSCCFSTIYK